MDNNKNNMDLSANTPFPREGKGDGVGSGIDIKAFLDADEKKDLLRLLTAGSVDDGKSTLIGRLLFDSKKLYEDQLQALERDSRRVGNAGAGEIDYALLLDGLKAEREEGITIDVAYRYFSTNQRKFIIADTPGHEQYTRNMITGGSTANLAIILVDARNGIITQTRRHTFLVSLLGIKHIVLAVNKMDLVDFDESVFNNIKKEYLALTEQLPVSPSLPSKAIMWWKQASAHLGTKVSLYSTISKLYPSITTVICMTSAIPCSMYCVRTSISADSVAKWQAASFTKATK